MPRRDRAEDMRASGEPSEPELPAPRSRLALRTFTNRIDRTMIGEARPLGPTRSALTATRRTRLIASQSTAHANDDPSWADRRPVHAASSGVDEVLRTSGQTRSARSRVGRWRSEASAPGRTSGRRARERRGRSSAPRSAPDGLAHVSVPLLGVVDPSVADSDRSLAIVRSAGRDLIPRGFASLLELLATPKPSYFSRGRGADSIGHSSDEAAVAGRLSDPSPFCTRVGARNRRLCG